MHLDAALVLVPSCLMSERAKIEVGIQLAIDAAQQIQIEGGRNAGRVVVCIQHAFDIFYQIGSNQEHVARIQRAVKALKEVELFSALKVSDGAAQKQKQQIRSVRPSFRKLPEAFGIVTMNGRDVHKRGKFAATGIQRLTRYVDREIFKQPITE